MKGAVSTGLPVTPRSPYQARRGLADFPGERHFKELVWGMLNAVGVPESASAAWAKLGGFPQKPIDLST